MVNTINTLVQTTFKIYHEFTSICFAVEKLVLNVSIKAFWHTNDLRVLDLSQ